MGFKPKTEGHLCSSAGPRLTWAGAGLFLPTNPRVPGVQPAPSRIQPATGPINLGETKYSKLRPDPGSSEPGQAHFSQNNPRVSGVQPAPSQTSRTPSRLPRTAASSARRQLEPSQAPSQGQQAPAGQHQNAPFSIIFGLFHLLAKYKDSNIAKWGLNM